MWKNMETNTCNVNNLDLDALLPPRKRLLAGLKRQNSDVNSPAPLPSSPNCAGSKNDACNNIYRSQLSNTNLSNEEIVEASRIAAIEAAKVAEAARANAEEKAAKAAEAVAAAKSALELVATLSEEAANKEKGHQQFSKNLKNASGSDTRSHKHKRLKSSAVSERPGISSGVPVAEGNRPSSTTSNGNGVVGDTDNEGSLKKIDMIMVDLNSSKPDKRDQLKLDNGEGRVSSKSDQMKLGNREVEALVSKDKFAESLDSFVKRGEELSKKSCP
ncbi:UNVERIFIED_CONTAM: hypothetical protein Sradi_1957400 [Sesamum radiatum]|uniref:Uncharacterized protein n=1 Tax=Sesamum radiatum TaxID=300843 RepID=A0AAW2THN3_SESRA